MLLALLFVLLYVQRLLPRNSFIVPIVRYHVTAEYAIAPRAGHDKTTWHTPAGAQGESALYFGQGAYMKGGETSGSEQKGVMQ